MLILAMLTYRRDKIEALIELIKQILQTEPVLQNLRKIQMQDDIGIPFHLPIGYILISDRY